MRENKWESERRWRLNEGKSNYLALSVCIHVHVFSLLLKSPSFDASINVYLHFSLFCEFVSAYYVEWRCLSITQLFNRSTPCKHSAGCTPLIITLCIHLVLHKNLIIKTPFYRINGNFINNRISICDIGWVIIYIGWSKMTKSKVCILISMTWIEMCLAVFDFIYLIRVHVSHRSQAFILDISIFLIDMSLWYYLFI